MIFFFFFALAIVSQNRKISEKVFKPEPHTALQKKRRSPTLWGKRKVVSSQNTKKFGPKKPKQLPARESFRGKNDLERSTFFQLVNTSIESPLFHAPPGARDFISLSLCVRVILSFVVCVVVCRRVPPPPRERDEREQEEDERRGFVDLSSS